MLIQMKDAIVLLMRRYYGVFVSRIKNGVLTVAER